MYMRMGLAALIHAAVCACFCAALPSLSAAAGLGDVTAVVVVVVGALVSLWGLRIYAAASGVMLAAVLSRFNPAAARGVAQWSVRISPRLLKVAVSAAVAGALGTPQAFAAQPVSAAPTQSAAPRASATSPAWPDSGTADARKPTTPPASSPATAPSGPSPAVSPAARPPATRHPAVSPATRGGASPNWPDSSQQPGPQQPREPQTPPSTAAGRPAAPGTGISRLPNPLWPDSSGQPPAEESKPRETQKNNRTREAARGRTPDNLPDTKGSHAGEKHTVTVRSGDSLWSIAARGHSSEPTAATAKRVASIYAKNRAVIGADPNLILPGQRLEMP